MTTRPLPEGVTHTLGTIADAHGVPVEVASASYPLAPGVTWPGATGPGVPLQPAKARTLAPLRSDEAQALVDELDRLADVIDHVRNRVSVDAWAEVLDAIGSAPQKRESVRLTAGLAWLRRRAEGA